MILADTSVWIDHLRSPEIELMELLHRQLVFVHPFVIGELALGNMRHRQELIDRLSALRQPRLASDAEVLAFIESEKLAGKGIGYIDAHLLASVRLSPGTLLWTRDKRLHELAKERRLAARLSQAPAKRPGR